MAKKLKILIVGGGGREHAIGWKVAQSEKCGKLYFAPGNGGTAQIGENVEIGAMEVEKLLQFAGRESIDLTLAIPDDPLSMGIVDLFQSEGLRIFGPTKAATRLESSKAFAKNFMKRHGLPTASFEVFRDIESAKKYLEKQKLPIVVKASGLALGKGVVICKTLKEAEAALENCFIKKIFGEAGKEVVIEEFLEGREISIHAFSDGENCSFFPPAQDHKKIGEGNTGPNTGGMGTIAPLSFMSVDLMKQIEEEIVAPTLRAMRDENMPFQGVLYPGLILTKEGPKILEFNARFGDPETQTYMRLLETDLLDIVDACLLRRSDAKAGINGPVRGRGSLRALAASNGIRWKSLFACTVVLASGGYPGTYEKGKEISGIEEAEQDPDVVIFHAGTAIKDGKLLTNGGRVLGISAIGKTLSGALKTAYDAASKISFDGMYYRKDIGKDALELKKTYDS